VSLNHERLHFMNTEELTSFAREKILNTMLEREEEGGFDHSLWDNMANMGIIGMVIDKKFGGGGASIKDFAESVALLAGEGTDLGLALSLVDHVMLCAYPLQVFGAQALKKKYLPSLCNGELIGATAISEPDSGGSPTRMRSTARRVDEGYVLDGVKGPITNAPVADVFLVLASTDLVAGKDGLSAFLVEKGDGVRVERIELDFLHTSPHGKVIMEGVRVPGDHLVGEEGWGHERISRSVFLWERTVIITVVTAFMEKWHHLVVSSINAEEISPDTRVFLAQGRVELTAYRILAERLLELTFDTSDGGKERMELLLFFGRALPAWVDSMRGAIMEANLPMDENTSRMLSDLRLLEVGRSILDWQFQKLLF
jgi:alkylation response protein AidB-like acyl-CoA dehydrogenase